MSIKELRVRFPEVEAFRLAGVRKEGKKEFVGDVMIRDFKAYRQIKNKFHGYRMVGRNLNYAYLIPIKSL